MRSNRGKDTALEVSIRSGLHLAGLRFKKHKRPLANLRCEADVVFPRQRMAVFIDGCFWHGCPQHATRPATNREWWAAKLDRNLERDALNTAELHRAGWVVVRIWEHEDVATAVRRVEQLLSSLAESSR
ncbi:MAG TPA: very short patch repair endonuclease [Chloroflexi bacterium]|jgi:DNA mismatch endonuclease (patch repair protein)|nr:very short patch repair endonuclease [Chloroflexota bacterium]